MPTTFQAPDASTFALPPQNPEEKFDLPAPEGPLEEIDPIAYQHELAERAKDLATPALASIVAPVAEQPRLAEAPRDPFAVHAIQTINQIVSMRTQRLEEAKSAAKDPTQLQEVLMDVVRHGIRRAAVSKLGKYRRDDARIEEELLTEEAIFVGRKAFDADPEVTQRYCFGRVEDDGLTRLYIDQISKNPAKDYRLVYIISPNGVYKDLTYHDGIVHPGHSLNEDEFRRVGSIVRRYYRRATEFYTTSTGEHSVSKTQ